ncbi:RICIN domain-containing protein [Zobellia sp.]|nr:RICIN domain-containing protein [Zobellia sp.]
MIPKQILTAINILLFFTYFFGQSQIDRYKRPIVGNQKPRIKVPVIAPNLDKKTFYIESAIGENNRFLRVKGANPDRNAPVDISVFNAGNETKFTFENAGNGYYYIRSNTQQRRAIHVRGNSKNPRAEVTIWDVVNQDNLKWKLVPAGDGYHYLQSKLGTYLNVQEGKDREQTPVWMWGFDEGKAQKWKLHSIDKPITFKREFYPKPIKDLCPTQLVKGDREFNGNGPQVYGSVEFVQNKNVFKVLIEFTAKETKSDWSTVQGEWVRNILTLPVSWRIDKILSPHKTSVFDYTTSSKPTHGHQFTDSGFRQNSLSMTKGGIAKSLRFVGDTGGNDISDNNKCSDDTRIVFIDIRPINLEITYAP